MNDSQLGNLVRSCIKKRRYPTEQTALEGINRAHKNNSKDELRVYFCKHCLGYHITHKPFIRRKRMLQLKIEKLTNVQTPKKAHDTDAGFDFWLPEDLGYIVQNGKNINIEAIKDGDIVRTGIAIYPQKSVLLPMGIKTEFNPGWSLVFFNRSGLASKKHLFRGACIVDSDYRGEIFVNLTNVSNEKQYLQPGEKLIQALMLPVPRVEVIEAKVNENTDRGEGGFGSTDKK